MLRRVASRVSLRSRERKLQLFLELLAAGPRHDRRRRRRHRRALRRRLDRQLLRGALPLAGADHRRRAHRARARSPRRSRRCAPCGPTAATCRSATREFDLGFSNAVVEHVAGGRDGPAAVRARALPRRTARLRDDAEPLLPARGAHAAPVRALAADRRTRASAACRFDDVLDPLGPKELASLFPYSVRVLNTGMTLIAVGPE